MNILIIIYTINWVYRLYEEYIVLLKKFIDKYYSKILDINIEYYDTNIDDEKSLLNKLDFDNYDRIFYSGNISFYNIIYSKYNRKLYFINIEQLSHFSYYKYISNVNDKSKIIDYSEENIQFLKTSYVPFLAPPYFENININKDDKTIDTLSIINNDYRKNIYEKIIIDNPNYNKLTIDNCYGIERDNLFNKTKIYINIHCSDDHKTMEMIRLVNLITRKVIIISQKSIYNNLLFLNKFIIICNNEEDFPTYINEILDNYDSYYEKIYGNFEEEYNNYILYIKENIDNLLR